MTLRSDKLIWIIEDDPSSRFVYDEILGIRYRLEFFPTISEFAKHFESKSAVLPNLLIADLRLPDGTFIDYLLQRDELHSITFPFIVVSSTDDLDILRICFEEGAADYLTKPFSRALLVAKVERLLAMVPNTRGASKDLVVDPISLEVRSKSGKPVKLTARELQILTLLTRAKGNALDRKSIFKAVWGETNVVEKALDVHLFNLRKKVAHLGVEIRFKPPSSFFISSEDRMKP